jgi:hypothetical protein
MISQKDDEVASGAPTSEKKSIDTATFFALRRRVVVDVASLFQVAADKCGVSCSSTKNTPPCVK